MKLPTIPEGDSKPLIIDFEPIDVMIAQVSSQAGVELVKSDKEMSRPSPRPVAEQPKG